MERLENKTDHSRAKLCVIANLAKRLSSKKHIALIRFVQGPKHLQKRGLPTSTGAGHGYRFAFVNPKINSSQCLNATAIERPAQIARLDQDLSRVIGHEGRRSAAEGNVPQ